MEILLWLVPPVVVTLVATAWVSWLGREGRGEIDPERAAARMARVLDQAHHSRYVAPAPPVPDRSTGVVVRPPQVARASEPGTDRPRRAS